jgi:hypothetical protein
VVILTCPSDRSKSKLEVSFDLSGGAEDEEERRPEEQLIGTLKQSEDGI